MKKLILTLIIGIFTNFNYASAETGFDWNFNSGWNISTTLDRIGKKGFGHQNYLKLNANKSF